MFGIAFRLRIKAAIAYTGLGLHISLEMLEPCALVCQHALVIFHQHAVVASADVQFHTFSVIKLKGCIVLGGSTAISASSGNLGSLRHHGAVQREQCCCIIRRPCSNP